MSLPHLHDYIMVESALAYTGDPTRDSMLPREAVQAAEDGSYFFSDPPVLKIARRRSAATQHNARGIALRHSGGSRGGKLSGRLG